MLKSDLVFSILENFMKLEPFTTQEKFGLTLEGLGT